MIKGVLFDMDGVLVDSEPFICKAAIMMFEEMGLRVVPEDFHPFVGMGENRYIGGVAEHHGASVDIEKVKARTYEIYETIVRGNLTPLPGVHKFISECRERGFRLALATSADRVKMEVNLREIGLTSGTFNSIVTGLDVKNKKPFPDIYIMAAERIGLDPYECLVVEDAVSGIKAGKSAGCRCLGLTTSFEAAVLAEADWICGTLNDVPEEAINW
ncbi:MAG TPA: HAD-IA family hydrolase [Bacteroidales bacterium]|nr:HAD-IA family hydrolase [Bacteroidales bacterium]